MEAVQTSQARDTQGEGHVLEVPGPGAKPPTGPGPQTVVEIPLDLIDPSPGNPRHVIIDAMVDPVAASIKLDGQKTPAKVRPKGDGRFEVFAGHIRRLAALKAGLTTLKCLVMDITPEQAFLEAVLDNRGQQMTWLDDYLVVEKMQALFPGMKQPEMASRLEVTQATVSRALKVVRLLNQASRDQIYTLCIHSAPYQVTARVILALAGLDTGSPDDPAKMEAALRVAVDRQLKEPQAKKLADWVKKGGRPEDFQEKGPKEASNDPLAAYWQQLGPGFKVKYKGGAGYEVHMTLQDGHQAFNAAMAAKKAIQAWGGGLAGAPVSAPIPAPNPTPASSPKGLGTLLGGFILAQAQPHLSRVFRWVLPRGPRWLRGLAERFQKLSPQHQAWAALIGLAVGLFGLRVLLRLL